MANPAVPDLSSQLVPLIILGVVLVVGIFVALATIISAVNYKPNPIKDRLLVLKGVDAEGYAKAQRGPFDDLKDALVTYSGPISKSLYGENKKYQDQVKTWLTEAGMPDTEAHVWKFLADRVATGLILGAVLGVLGLVAFAGNVVLGMGGALGGFVLGSMWPQFSIKGKAKKRKDEIRFKMSDTLDLMVVCVEAGLGMDSTISRVADETEQMAPEISHEFKRLNKELNAGISRQEAFHNMGLRAGVDELRSLCNMIIQADKMGTSIADTLRVFADDLRVRRRQKAEELASKASIKMTFPLVFFIFPPLFIILMGPMAIKAFGTFFGGG